MNGCMKRKQSEGSREAADPFEPASTAGGDTAHPQEQQAGPQQQAEGQWEQAKRQKQEDGTREAAKQVEELRGPTHAVAGQDGGPVAQAQVQADVGGTDPAGQQQQPQQVGPEQQRQAGEQLEQAKRQQQQDRPVEKGAELQERAHAEAHGEGASSAGAQTQAAAPGKQPAGRQPQPRSEQPRHRHTASHRDAAMRHAAQTLPQRWPLSAPPSAQQQQRWQQPEWRGAQGPRAHLPPPPQPSMASWQPGAQPWQAATSGSGWQQPQVWGSQQAQLGGMWDAPLGQAPAWDPASQQWPAAHELQAQRWPAPAAPLAAAAAAAAAAADPWQQALAPPPAPVAQASAAQHPALALQQQQQLVQQQALALQQQALALQQQAQQAPLSIGPLPRSKLERDLPRGGQGESLLRLAVRICCERLGSGEHDGRQLGKVLEELDRDWRRGRCGGYSVSVLLRELDRRRLVLAREEMVSGKRVCFFRNLAC